MAKLTPRTRTRVAQSDIFGAEAFTDETPATPETPETPTTDETLAETLRATADMLDFAAGVGRLARGKKTTMAVAKEQAQARAARLRALAATLPGDALEPVALEAA